MKRRGMASILLALAMFALVGCDVAGAGEDAQSRPSTGSVPPASEAPALDAPEDETPNKDSDGTAPSGDIGGKEHSDVQGGDGEGSADSGTLDDPNDDPNDGPNDGPTPSVSPLAALDRVNVSAAFGDREAAGWSFALKAEGDMTAAYGFSLTSEISDEEKLNLECGLGVGLQDVFGVRSDDGNDFGFGLFGGGNANLALNYRGPAADSDPVQKSFDVGFRHDGDLVWYAGEGDEETKITLSDLQTQLQDAAVTETFARMERAFAVIPEEIKKGASLRFAVEKLIDLGFTAQIDDTDGIAVSLTANAGFYTDLLNDMLEEFLPAKWLDYLPRADFGYERTFLNIKLAFDENGIFKEYSMSSDVAVTASLEVRNLFYSESTVKVGGGFTLSAYHGEVPDGAPDEEAAA